MAETEEQTGYLELPQGRIFYRIFGKPGKMPLLVLHGGPGGTSDYLVPFKQLADERQVIIYDQFGSGRSDRLHDPRYWTVDYFVSELGLVREKLGLKEVHLFGHSWGTQLATDYLFEKPLGVKSMIFGDPCISIPRWIATCEKHLSEMPNNWGQLILESERTEQTDTDEYKTALAYYKKYYETRAALPPKSPDSVFGEEVYNYMWGPTEYTVTGTLKDYDHSERLKEIKLPALFICGRNDSASPEDCKYYQSLMPGSELKVFENSAHFPFVEEPQLFLETLRDFLRRND